MHYANSRLKNVWSLFAYIHTSEGLAEPKEILFTFPLAQQAFMWLLTAD